MSPLGGINPLAPLTPPAPVEVKTPSGATTKVLGPGEASFYNQERDRYLRENQFTNNTDLLDLDRLLFLEVQVYRLSIWLGEGRDYEAAEVNHAQLHRYLKETNAMISQVKGDLGLSKSARDKSHQADVGDYLTKLLQRARQFGIVRNKQVLKAITLQKQLHSIVGAFDRSDEIERRKLGFETEKDIVDWIRNVAKPEFDGIDEAFRKEQALWVRGI